jgi:hypothetical protein
VAALTFSEKNPKVKEQGRSLSIPAILAGLLVMLILIVIAVVIVNKPAGRQQPVPNAEYARTHKQFSSLAEAEAILGNGYLFNNYPDDGYSTEAEIEFSDGGSIEDRETWKNIVTVFEKEDIWIYIEVYLPASDNINKKGHLDPGKTSKIRINNTEVTYSIYDEKSGFSPLGHALVAHFDHGENHYLVEYMSIRPIESVEDILSELIR